jgi:hypothetical protein
MTIRRTSKWVAAMLAIGALVAAPAATAAKSQKPKSPPQIRSTTITLDDVLGNVEFGAEVTRASHVNATVGTGAIRKELTLVPTDEARTTLWTAVAAQGVETCLPVRIVARNAAGHDVHTEDVCVFGLTGPPPSFTFPFIGLG